MKTEDYFGELTSVSNWIELIRLYSENRGFDQDRYEKYLLRQLDTAFSSLSDKLQELVNLDAALDAGREIGLEIKAIQENPEVLRVGIPDDGADNIPDDVDVRDYQSFNDYSEEPSEPVKVKSDGPEEDSVVNSQHVFNRLQLMLLKNFGILPSSIDLRCLIPLSSFYDKFVSSSKEENWLKYENDFNWDIIFKGELGASNRWSYKQFSFWDFLSLNLIVNIFRDSLYSLEKNEFGSCDAEAVALLSGLRNALYSYVSKNDYSILCFENRNELIKGICEIFDCFELWDENEDEVWRLNRSKDLVDLLFPVKFHGRYYFTGSTLERAVLQDQDFLLDENEDVLVSPAVPNEHKWFGGKLSVLLSGKMPKVMDTDPLVRWVLGNEDEDIPESDCISVFGVFFCKWKGPVYRSVLNRVLRMEVEEVSNGQAFKYKKTCSLDEALDYVFEYDCSEYGSLLPLQVSEDTMFKSFKDAIPYLAVNFVLATGSNCVMYPDVYSVLQKYRPYIKESEEVRLAAFRLVLRENNLGFVSDALPDDSILELLRHLNLPAGS